MHKVNMYTEYYKGIPYEIRQWENALGETNWAGYFYINIKQATHDLWLKSKPNEYSRVWYPYEETILGRIDFHGGITYYEKTSGFDGADKIIKIGCDYQHYYDEGCHYTVEQVASDTRHAIDSFLEMVDYKVRCIGNGQIYNSDKGYFENGYFKSFDYYGKNY